MTKLSLVASISISGPSLGNASDNFDQISPFESQSTVHWLSSLGTPSRVADDEDTSEKDTYSSLKHLSSTELPLSTLCATSNFYAS